MFYSCLCFIRNAYASIFLLLLTSWAYCTVVSSTFHLGYLFYFAKDTKLSTDYSTTHSTELLLFMFHVSNVYWVLVIFTIVNSKKGPAITYSASYSMDSCPLAFSYCFSLHLIACYLDKMNVIEIKYRMPVFQV